VRLVIGVLLGVGGDYEDELKAISSELNGIINDLTREGYSIVVKPIMEVSGMDDIMNHADDLRGVHVAILLPIALLLWIPRVVYYDCIAFTGGLPGRLR